MRVPRSLFAATCAVLPVIFAQGCGGRDIGLDSLMHADERPAEQEAGPAAQRSSTAPDAGAARDASRLSPAADGGDAAGGLWNSDASADARTSLPPDASDGRTNLPEQVRVVDSNGDGVEGIAVLVSSEDGEVVAIARTDADGMAVVDVPPGGALSVFRERPVLAASGETLRREIVMMMGVPDGHSFAFSIPAAPTPVPIESMGVEVTLDNAPSASAYRVALLCGESRQLSTTTTTFSNYAGCGRLATFDVHAIALDSNSMRLAHASALDRPFVAGGTESITVDGWSTDFQRLPYSVGPIPTGASSLLGAVTGYRPGHFEASARAGLRDELRLMSLGSEVDALLGLPAGLFSTFRLVGNVELSQADPRVISGFDRFGTELPNGLHFDPLALAIFEELFVVDTGDPLRPAIGWAVSDAGRLGDAMRLALSWPSEPMVTTQLIVTMPASRSGEVSLPVVPEELEAFLGLGANATFAISGLHVDDVEQPDYASYLSSSRAGDAQNTDTVSAFR